MVTEPLLPPEGLDRGAEGRLTGADLAPALAAAHLPHGEFADALAHEAVEHAKTWAAQDALRGRVATLGRPTVELPKLVGPVDLGCLFELSERLEEHLAVGSAA
jgi:hypothetical protein